jgi:hypothetical protein
MAIAAVDVQQILASKAPIYQGDSLETNILDETRPAELTAEVRM